MLKAGSVQLLLARSICSGKFLIVVSGDRHQRFRPRSPPEPPQPAPRSLSAARSHACNPTVLQAIFADRRHSAQPAQVARRHWKRSPRPASLKWPTLRSKTANVTLLKVHLAWLSRQRLRGYGRRPSPACRPPSPPDARPPRKTACSWAKASSQSLARALQGIHLTNSRE